MTAVTFPLRPHRLAFAICGRRWQNDVYENKVYLTIIPRGRVGYEMINSQRGA